MTTDPACTRCGSTCTIDGDLTGGFWAWCDECDDYASGFDGCEWAADHYAGLADARDAEQGRAEEGE